MKKQKRTVPKVILGLIALLLLGGCILVDDFGEYWNKGIIDEKLEGKWHNQSASDSGLEIVREGDHYRIIYTKQNQEYEEAKTIILDGYSFLMVKQKKDKTGGVMYPYIVENNKLVFFAPDKKKKDEFIRNFVSKDTEIYQASVRVKILNEDTAKLLKDIAKREDYWVVFNRYYKQ